MFHYPNVEWAKLQAEAIGLPIVVWESEGKKEDELSDLEMCLSTLKRSVKIDGVVSGAVASEYQKTRVERICQDLDLASFSPLWRKNPEFLIGQEVDFGFEIIISACMARGFTIEWLGRKIDLKCVDELKEINRKYGVHMAFEGGEAETFVTDGPIFKRKIVVRSSENMWKNDSGYLRIIDAKLQMKQQSTPHCRSIAMAASSAPL
jgi:ABC transporter with metal-binding/Fe-S-binding domain ATP-binding protein